MRLIAGTAAQFEPLFFTTVANLRTVQHHTTMMIISSQLNCEQDGRLSEAVSLR